MAVGKQIYLGVYRDRHAPFDPSAGVTKYNPTKGKSFNTDCIKNIRNVVEGTNTYGVFTYHPTDGTAREEVWVLEASGAIIAQTNV